MNDPYKNNDYLRDNQEVLEEVLFFEQFGRKLHDTGKKEPREKESGEESEKGDR